MELKFRPFANVHRVSCDSLHACYTVMYPLYFIQNLGFVYHTKIPDTFRGSTLDHAPLPSTLRLPNLFFSSVLPLRIRFALMSMYPDERLFDGYILVYWSLHKVPLLPSVRLVALAENKPQHNQRSFLRLFPLLILSVVPSPVHIICTPKLYLCLISNSLGW